MGSGKSLVFQLLGVVYPYWMNVGLMPTRALIQDQIARLKERGLNAKHVTSVSEIIRMDPGLLVDAVRCIPYFAFVVCLHVVLPRIADKAVTNR